MHGAAQPLLQPQGISSLQSFAPSGMVVHQGENLFFTFPHSHLCGLGKSTQTSVALLQVNTPWQIARRMCSNKAFHAGGIFSGIFSFFVNK